MSETLLDKLGQEITPGVWIVYGHALGRCAGLRIGKVLAVDRGPEDTRCPWNRQDRITVWGINDDYIAYHRFNPDDEWAKPKALSKKSTLLFSSRIVVLKDVPMLYRKALWEKLNDTKLPPDDAHLVYCKNPAHCTGNCYEI